MPPTTVFHLGLHQSACELLDELAEGHPVLSCLLNCREGLAGKKGLGFRVLFHFGLAFPYATFILNLFKLPPSKGGTAGSCPGTGGKDGAQLCDYSEGHVIPVRIYGSEVFVFRCCS